jgi:hypothetical protein
MNPYTEVLAHVDRALSPLLALAVTNLGVEGTTKGQVLGMTSLCHCLYLAWAINGTAKLNMKLNLTELAL